jgi:hypothetical protein
VNAIVALAAVVGSFFLMALFVVIFLRTVPADTRHKVNLVGLAALLTAMAASSVTLMAAGQKLLATLP